MATNTFSKVATSTGPLLIGGGVVVAGFALWFTLRELYGWGEKVAGDLDKWVNKDRQGFGTSDNPGPTWTVKEAVLGKGTHHYPDGTEIYNPLAGVPVIGSLFSSGMNIGLKWNPLKNHPDSRY